MSVVIGPDIVGSPVFMVVYNIGLEVRIGTATEPYGTSSCMTYASHVWMIKPVNRIGVGLRVHLSMDNLAVVF